LTAHLAPLLKRRRADELISPLVDTASTPSDGTCSETEGNGGIPPNSATSDAEQALQTCIEEDIKKWSGSAEKRPTLSYARLAAMAIHASPAGRCTVGEIYAWVEKKFVFYGGQGSQWYKVRSESSCLKTMVAFGPKCLKNSKTQSWRNSSLTLSIHPSSAFSTTNITNTL